MNESEVAEDVIFRSPTHVDLSVVFVDTQLKAYNTHFACIYSLPLSCFPMHVSPQDTTTVSSPDLHQLRRDDVWFEDGNLILQTDDALFRVYSGLLAARSSVFRDMLAFPQPPDGNLTHENCPVVRIYDSTKDVHFFLNAIFDSE